MRMLTCNFATDWNVTSNNRKLVLGCFNQRQAEALSVGRSDQASASGIDSFKILIATHIYPEKTFPRLAMRTQALSEPFNQPALLSNYNELDIYAVLPKFLKGI